MDGGMDMGMDHPPKMEENGMQGNLTYLHVALFGFIHGGLELFRYHDDTEYDNGDFMSTNIWEMAGQLHHYSHFGIMGLLTVTQILSMVGVAGELDGLEERDEGRCPRIEHERAHLGDVRADWYLIAKIGRASCRERV